MDFDQCSAWIGLDRIDGKIQSGTGKSIRSSWSPEAVQLPKIENLTSIYILFSSLDGETSSTSSDELPPHPPHHIHPIVRLPQYQQPYHRMSLSSAFHTR